MFCDVALFNPSFRFVRIVFFSWFIHLTGVLCPYAQAISFYQAFHLFSTGVLYEIFLTPCSIHSIVSEAVCCDFIKYLLILPSPYSNPFSFQSECCLKLFFLVTLFYRSVFNFVHLRCILSFNLFNLSRVFSFTHLSKKQLSFTSSLSLLFSLRCHSRSRDEILS